MKHTKKAKIILQRNMQKRWQVPLYNVVEAEKEEESIASNLHLIE